MNHLIADIEKRRKAGIDLRFDVNTEPELIQEIANSFFPFSFRLRFPLFEIKSFLPFLYDECHHKAKRGFNALHKEQSLPKPS
jgi:hypothetical protein